MKKVLINQPAKIGDVINIIPIAQKLISKGYTVYVPHIQYTAFLFNKDYFNDINTFNSDRVNLPEWCNKNDILFVNTQNMDEKYKPLCTYFGGDLFIEQIKYYIANDLIEDVEILYEDKYDLKWNRNLEREEELFKVLNLNKNEDYVVSHLRGENGRTGKLPTDITIRNVELEKIGDFTHFDWYSVIKNAKGFYGIQSSFQCFVDCIINHLDYECYLLNDPSNPDRLVVPANNWNRSHFINNRLI
jgi:hypothetical protein